MITPRGTEPTVVLLDLASYQRKRFECLNAQGGLTQEVIQTLLSILKNATIAGQTHARVQTLHLAKDYAYSRRQPPDEKAHPVYDAQTLLPIQGTVTRVHLAARPRELTEWLHEQKVHFIIATSCTAVPAKGCEPAFADFMHIIALFVPEKASINPSIWNSAFLQKSLDQSMVTSWNEKCLAAIRIGASHFAVCILYYRLDYRFMPHGGETELDDSSLVCAAPRENPSMTLAKDCCFKLESKCVTLVAWSRQIGYSWTLATGSHNWAYFTVLLDPINKYV